jgi:type I restriction enzyme, S subunit
MHVHFLMHTKQWFYGHDRHIGSATMSAVNRIPSGYRQTEVGVIPEDWDVRPLGELTTTVASGRSKSKATYGDYAVHGSTGVIGYSDTSEYKGDAVLVARVGANAGKLNIVSGEYGVTDNTIIVRFGSGSCLPFFWRQMESKNLNSLVFGSGQPLITGTQLKALAVCVPPLSEQRAIATALSDVDALLAAQDKLIAKKRDIKQAAMQQLLTGKQRLPGFSGEWEVKRLGDLATFYKGKGLPKSALSSSGAEPCIHYGELFTRYPETILEIISRTDTTSGTFRSVANDVLMPTSDVTPRGLAKASCVTVENIILGGDILVIRSDRKRVCGTFLSYVIRSEEEQVLQLVTGSTVFHLYGSDMKKFTFSMPSLDEQTAIATILSDMDADLAALEQQRDKTRALKQGMMQELLTGRIRLV